STLEEKMPGLPPVSPEIMGTLKTLAQIAEYLVGNSKPETENRKPSTENQKGYEQKQSETIPRRESESGSCSKQAGRVMLYNRRFQGGSGWVELNAGHPDADR
ncbi:hypothetical protein QUF72_11875, partial [Desulfobacterales bacterium HSG2]|nr:hypothetical protein [Desulfobacterales bacterium HSG2]